MPDKLDQAICGRVFLEVHGHARIMSPINRSAWSESLTSLHLGPFFANFDRALQVDCHDAPRIAHVCPSRSLSSRNRSSSDLWIAFAWMPKINRYGAHRIVSVIRMTFKGVRRLSFRAGSLQRTSPLGPNTLEWAQLSDPVTGTRRCRDPVATLKRKVGRSTVHPGHLLNGHALWMRNRYGGVPLVSPQQIVAIGHKMRAQSRLEPRPNDGGAQGRGAAGLFGPPTRDLPVTHGRNNQPTDASPHQTADIQLQVTLCHHHTASNAMQPIAMSANERQPHVSRHLPFGGLFDPADGIERTAVEGPIQRIDRTSGFLDPRSVSSTQHS
ncbi:hypothetical protein BCR44DRAFT_168400 [Catenaria anguillulae PL171]|uniref:Uncharacterized protein n=1 Tax=Catenaria anguillulae PL171 TaxID=765915 RepID=A0A1Y2HEG0_9FUNG|nr:hypothetical protein BCR44DRAFT_168400 [Catenaria anguillulae PL171]